MLNDAANGLIGRDELAAFTDNGAGGDIGVVLGLSPVGSALKSDGTGGSVAGVVRFAGANDCGIVNVGPAGVAAVGANRLAGVVTAPAGIVVPVPFDGIT